MSLSDKTASQGSIQRDLTSLLRDTLIVVPVLNEEGNIAPTVNAIKIITPNSPILFVEGNSSDASLQEIHKLVVMYDNVNVIQQHQVSLADAYLRAYQFALRRNYRAVIQMDADGYHIAKNIIELAAAYLQEPGLVLGVRAKNDIGAEYQRNLIRHLLTRLGNHYVRLWLLTGVNDNTTGFRMLSRDLIDAVSNSAIMSRGFSFQAEVVHLARSRGFNIKEVEMQFGARLSGKSKLSSRIFLESLLLPPLLKIRLLWKSLSRQST